MFQMTKLRLLLSVLALSMLCSACSHNTADYYGGEGSDPSELGVRSSEPLLNSGASTSATPDERARHALEVMNSYRRSQEPQPYDPVLQPAEVRLMWIPDHLNKNGDLVPAHYYYLKVLPERWAVQDAFDLEQQLNTASEGSGGLTPWVYGK